MDFRNYSVALRNAGVSPWIVDALGEKYPDIPGHIIYQIVNDDRRMGIGNLSIPYSNPEVSDHDTCMLLDRLGYRITTIAETQGRFFGGTILRGLRGAGFASVALPIAVVGSVVGGVIMIVREIVK